MIDVMNDVATHVQTKRNQAGHPVTADRASLPGVDGRSTWARLFRAEVRALSDHLGGDDRISEPHRMLIRRAATYEAELVQLELELAQARADGAEVADGKLDLYQRLTNSQRRVLEAIGLTRQAFDAVPTLDSYVNGKAKQDK